MHKLAIIGYGKMGKMIEKYAPDFNFKICAIIDPFFNNTITKEELQGAEVAVEFTTPNSAIDNYKNLINSGVNVVTGTTGWHDKMDFIQSLVEHSGLGFFHASNFSIGMNMVFELNKQLAKMAQKVEGYSAKITETHHTQKLDTPSGTAVTLAQGIMENLKKYKNWELDTNLQSNESLPVAAIREGNVVGLHTVEYKSGVDRIVLEHEAFSREGFAIGALTACQYMLGKRGIHTMQNLLAL
jgi:4-hydroxy-tetrahydrodipicolinate reductase